MVPAYLEPNMIGRKLDDLQASGYEGDLQIVVVADDGDTAAAARRPGVEVLEARRRSGKAAALNRGVAAARHPIVVITDANTVLAPGALGAMTRWFSDPSVGAVAGEKQIREGHEGFYWRYEAWLKRHESRRGSTVGLVGELAAFRRDVFRPLPPDVAVDDLWIALDVFETGLRIMYEPSAIAFEDASASWREDWERRTRVVSGAFDVLWRRRAMLNPARSPVAIELWGHRLLRQSAGPVAHGGLLCLALARIKHSSLALAFVLAHLAAVQGLVRAARGERVSPPERIAAQVLSLQVVAFGGMARYVRRDRPALWPKAAR